MRKLLIASNNKGKILEIKSILAGVYDDIASLKDEKIDIDVVEDGDTFLANARKKAAEISLLTDWDVLSDDSGLCVEGLGGAPGVYSARYSGKGDAANNEKLLAEVAKLPQTERGAKFVSAVCIFRKGHEVAHYIGEWQGTITLEPKGENGFGYDPLFYLEELGQTSAQLDPKEKNSISHRAKALNGIFKLLSNSNL